MTRQRLFNNFQGYPNVQARSRMAVQCLVALAMLLCVSGWARVAPAHASTTFVVTTTADSGGGTLRWALQNANLTPGLDVIAFGIPGGGPFRIQPATDLPEITDPVVLDGTTQPGFAGTPVIEIDGSRLVHTAFTIRAGGSGSTIRGLVINRLDQSTGISMIDSTHNLIAGNFIGTDASGTAAVGTHVFGIAVTRGSNNVIGGPAARDRNLIAGGYSPGGAGINIEGQYNVVQGNLIGTNASGTAAIPIPGRGVSVEHGSHNTIGPGNVISGGGRAGVEISSRDPGFPSNANVVRGNLIGTNVSGTAALPNSGAGVRLAGFVFDSLIGGSSAADRNVISGNAENGVLITRNGSYGGAPDGNQVQGNYIGTSAAGTADLGNGLNGVLVEYGSDNTIGPGNLVSGNQGSGVSVTSVLLEYSVYENIVRGNLIGTNAGGTAALPNSGAGIRIGGFSYQNVVGGNFAVDRNVISGNGGDGIAIVRDGVGGIPGGNILWGNYVGTNALGSAAIPNQLSGVNVQGQASLNFVGGSLASNRNVISGNAGSGVLLDDARYTTVQNNLIGLNAGGTAALPNAAHGVSLVSSAAGNFISGNQIAFNAGAGVRLYFAGSGNLIRSNNIYDNGRLGIDLLKPSGANVNDAGDLDSGPNGLQNHPVLISPLAGLGTVNVSGSLDSQAGTTYLIEFFASPACDSSGHGEGRRILGTITITTNAAGHADFTAKSLPAGPGEHITATALHQPTGDTSEFSRGVIVR